MRQVWYAPASMAHRVGHFERQDAVAVVVMIGRTVWPGSPSARTRPVKYFGSRVRRGVVRRRRAPGLKGQGALSPARRALCWWAC